MDTRFRDNRGFSLIELVVVVALIGLLIAMVIPATVSFMNSGRVSGASQMLAADIHYARSLATSQQTTYRILFRNGTYRVFCVAPASTLLARTLPKGVACNASDTLRFYPWGLTNPATVRFSNGHATETVTLASNGSVTHD